MAIGSQELNKLMVRGEVVVYVDRRTRDRFHGVIERIWKRRDGAVGVDLITGNGVPSVIRCLAEDLETEIEKEIVT